MAETSVLMLWGGFIPTCTASERAVKSAPRLVAHLCHFALTSADASGGSRQLSTFEYGFVACAVFELVTRSAKRPCHQTSRRQRRRAVLVLDICNSH
jgi:hypothetical protein